MEKENRNNNDREKIISSWINVIDWSSVTTKILEWAKDGSSHYVCICNVHSVVTARSNRHLREAINESALSTPDGMPIAWLIGWRRRNRQERINGPDLTLRLCQEAEVQGIRVAFYGSTEVTLERLRVSLARKFPHLKIAAMISPPFGTLADVEQTHLLNMLNESRANIVFVGLGCPKQEIWMAEHSHRIGAALIGVGAAFDYLAGTVTRPPLWMQNAGLEWFGRLIAEPRRLWRRYFFTNTIYFIYLMRELLTQICRTGKTDHGERSANEPTSKK